MMIFTDSVVRCVGPRTINKQKSDAHCFLLPEHDHKGAMLLYISDSHLFQTISTYVQTQQHLPYNSGTS